ncbi:unnamed protein product [Cylicocyclus nassatus]|uniref:Uncharacterized protein n=1 Tax=Cylicocyclus nassatus TaxID=53992 RepID=A0AA36MCP7_CYLNA|nr:unnamed protein product [Cylicocyclus nassatus]
MLLTITIIAGDDRKIRYFGNLLSLKYSNASDKEAPPEERFHELGDVSCLKEVKGFQFDANNKTGPNPFSFDLHLLLVGKRCKLALFPKRWKKCMCTKKECRNQATWTSLLKFFSFYSCRRWRFGITTERAPAKFVSTSFCYSSL